MAELPKDVLSVCLAFYFALHLGARGNLLNKGRFEADSGATEGEGGGAHDCSEGAIIIICGDDL